MEIQLSQVVIDILKAINNLLQEICASCTAGSHAPLMERRIWTKQDVMAKFNMSDATYNRNLAKELLVPMRLSGEDTYFDEDLLRALEESRRKGKI